MWNTDAKYTIVPTSKFKKHNIFYSNLEAYDSLEDLKYDIEMNYL